MQNLVEQIEVELKIENVEKINDFLKKFFEKFEHPLKMENHFDVAVDEIFSNVLHYSGADNLNLVVCVDTDKRFVSMTFVDSGKAFNPLENDDPDVTLIAEKRKIGGLGIFLVKKLMDVVEYKRENEKNVLKIVKFFN